MHVLCSQSVRDSVQVERQTKIDGSAEWSITCRGTSFSLFLCMRGQAFSLFGRSQCLNALGSGG